MKSHLKSVVRDIRAVCPILAGMFVGMAALSGCSSSSNVSSQSPPFGVISTVAGGGNSCPPSTTGCLATSTQLPGPMGVVVDASGNLLIGTYEGGPTYGEVFGVAANAHMISSAASAGFGYGAAGMAADGAGNLFIADQINNLVEKGKVLVSAAGVITITGIATVAGGGSGCSQQTDSLGDGCPATSAVLSGPTGVALDASGNLYIADSHNNRVRKVTAANGVISTVAGNGTAGFVDNTSAINAELNYPIAVAVDASGNLYVTDQWNNRIRKVSVSTGNISVIAGSGPTNCQSSCGGYSGDGATATSARLDTPSGIAVDSSGNLYIADENNYRVRKVDASGSITTVAGVGQSCLGLSCNGQYGGFSGDGGDATKAALNLPTGVAVDGSGNLYIADSGNNRIRMVNASK